VKNWTIGNRSRHEADLGLDDNTVSGLHAVLTRTDDGRWIVKDHNSTNGTARFVNGQWIRIREAYVLPDDRLRFGRAETTVRRLLASPAGDLYPVQGNIVPWTQDLVAAFSQCLSLSQAKQSLLFVPDLISSPTKHIARCAYRGEPVNPFCFMIFCGLIYTMITASGMSISNLLNPIRVESALQQTFVAGIPKFIGPLTFTLILNMFGFGVFRSFSPRRRSFDDFMRMTAVLSGMSWMLQAFILLLVNEHPRVMTDAITVYLLAVVVTIYMAIFNIIGYKHFWKISYARATLCSVLTALAVFIAVLIVILPLGLIAGLDH
jgi:hypothetical protein